MGVQRLGFFANGHNEGGCAENGRTSGGEVGGGVTESGRTKGGCSGGGRTRHGRIKSQVWAHRVVWAIFGVGAWNVGKSNVGVYVNKSTQYVRVHIHV